MPEEFRIHPESELTPAAFELEAALSALRPAGPALERDQLMFRAGETTARQRAARQIGVWRSAAAVLLLLGLGASMLGRGSRANSPGTLGNSRGGLVSNVPLVEAYRARRHPVALETGVTPKAWLSNWFAPSREKPAPVLCLAQAQPALDLSIPLTGEKDDDSQGLSFSLHLGQ